MSASTESSSPASSASPRSAPPSASKPHRGGDHARIGALGDHERAARGLLGTHAGEGPVAVVPAGQHLQHDRVVEVVADEPLAEQPDQWLGAAYHLGDALGAVRPRPGVRPGAAGAHGPRRRPRARLRRSIGWAAQANTTLRARSATTGKRTWVAPISRSSARPRPRAHSRPAPSPAATAQQRRDRPARRPRRAAGPGRSGRRPLRARACARGR